MFMQNCVEDYDDLVSSFREVVKDKDSSILEELETSVTEDDLEEGAFIIIDSDGIASYYDMTDDIKSVIDEFDEKEHILLIQVQSDSSIWYHYGKASDVSDMFVR